MNLNLRSALPLLMGVAIFYSACTKTDGNSPSKTTTSTKTADQASVAIAKNLVQSLAGSFGGASINDGVNPSVSFSASPKLKIQSTEHRCGFFIDTSLNLTFNQGDTLKAHKTGGVSYYFVCSDNKTIGYDLVDSVRTVGSGPGYTFTYAITQNFNVRGLNSNNSNFSLNGKLKSWTDNAYTQNQTFTNVHNTYTFTDLYVHADDNFDITSGSATFTSEGKTNGGGWQYSGTITFLGNHAAKLIFLNKAYLVNTWTGDVKPY